MNNIKIVVGILKMVKEDCSSQEQYLINRQDVCWDCYDPKNWKSMVDSLQEAIDMLNNKQGDNHV